MFGDRTTKKCSKCGKVQPLNQFYRAKGTRDGLRGDCKVCFAARAQQRYASDPETAKARVKRWQAENREQHLATQRKRRSRPEVKARERDLYLRRKYGMTMAEYDALLERQGGVCAICGRPPRDDISLHVDHEHETGAIRGLLCFRCNNAVGDFDDDPVVLQRAGDYLAPIDTDLVDRTRQRVRALVTAR